MPLNSYLRRQKLQGARVDKAKLESPTFVGELTYNGKTIASKDNRPVDLPQLDDYAAMIDGLRKGNLAMVVMTWDEQAGRVKFQPQPRGRRK